MIDALNRLVEQTTRSLARKISRRHFLARLGSLLGGALLLPLLPVERGGASSPDDPPAGATDPGGTRKQDFASAAQTDDPTRCDYWRYCAFDGYPCASCGGSHTSCPPGTTPSPSSWVGTCVNPEDDRSYLISYNDCCGKNSCGRDLCTNTVGETPLYRPQRNNDIVWCHSMENQSYHCTVALKMGTV